MADRSIPTLSELMKLRVVELKGKLTKLGLSTTGLKADLVVRLYGAYQNASGEDETDDNEVLMHEQVFTARKASGSEVERTKKFAVEVLELLCQSPQSQMAFQKFISAYNHHFGLQCRMSNYGFTNLHELFEAILHKIHGEGDQKILISEEQELLKVLTDQITTFLKIQP